MNERCWIVEPLKREAWKRETLDLASARVRFQRFTILRSYASTLPRFTAHE